MVSSLDPHSRYVLPEDSDDSQSQITGEFGGLGIEVTLDERALKIVSVLDGTPAAKAGLAANDRILSIDGKPVTSLSLAQAVANLRGPVDSSVVLTLSRDGDGPSRDVTLVRETVAIRSTEIGIKAGDVGYVRITHFTQQTYPGLEQGMAALERTGAMDRLKGTILDLRNNPGGLVDQAVLVSDAFLERGQILSMRGRTAEDTKVYLARVGDLSHGKPLIVLVNAGSASASEIVAGALQDQKRATVLGTRTFGKGTVQGIIPLANNGSLYLTTARYFTPSGRSIQAKGIAPDIEIEETVPPGFEGSGRDLGERALAGHLESPGVENTPVTDERPSSSYVPADERDDTQLQTAMRLLRGEETHPLFPPLPATYTELRN